MAIEVILKKWGNSIGIVLPKGIVEEKNLKKNDKIFVELVKEADLTKLFGTIKRKVSGQKFKNKVRNGWEN